VAGNTNIETQSTNDRLTPFCRNYYINTYSTFLNFAFTLFRFSYSITVYLKLANHQVPQASFGAEYFMYQPHRLVRPFWTDRMKTEHKSVASNTQNIYQLHTGYANLLTWNPSLSSWHARHKMQYGNRRQGSCMTTLPPYPRIRQCLHSTSDPWWRWLATLGATS
jgi:hypothetical protein